MWAVQISMECWLIWVKMMLETIFKGTVKRILYFAGLFTSPRGIRILLYHSIDDSGSVVSTSLSSFERQMKYLKKNGYHTISLSNFASNVYTENKPSEKLLVITFDDGYRNNYFHAFPILKKYGFTATIFLATDYINSSAKWVQRDFDLIFDRIFHSSINGEQTQTYKGVSDVPLLTWDEIKEMSDYGIDFGTHTASHIWLSDVTLDKAREEICKSRAILEHNLNKPINCFCYPYSDLTPEVKQLVKELGFSVACSGTLQSSNQNSDMYDFKRAAPYPADSFFEFKFLFSSGYDWYIALKNKLRRWTKLK